MNMETPEELSTSAPAEQQEVTEKKKKKKGRKVLLLFLVLVAGWGAYALLKPLATGPGVNPLYLVPEDAMVVLETRDPFRLWSDVSSARAWEILEQDEEWRSYGEQLNELQTRMDEFGKVATLFSDRSVYFSIHDGRKKDVDFLAVADLSGLAVVREWLVRQDGVSKRTFNGSCHL